MSLQIPQCLSFDSASNIDLKFFLESLWRMDGLGGVANLLLETFVGLVAEDEGYVGPKFRNITDVLTL